jgi:hypothetical protein
MQVQVSRIQTLGLFLGWRLFCWAEGYLENRAEMLVTYRLFENKQSTLEARRAGVQGKAYVFICWMAQRFKVKFCLGSKCEFQSLRLIL